MVLHNLLKDLQKKTSSKKALQYKKFFKEIYMDKKDRFIGVSVKDQRVVIRKHLKTTTMQDLQKLLKSDIHEYRMLAGIMLTDKFRYNKDSRDEIFEFYLKNIKRFNNWDLVDSTCYKIVGWYLLDKKNKRKFLYDLAKDGNLFERRIAMVSTFEFIRHNELDDTLKLAKLLLRDKHDLIQKAIGWMLKEAGKKDKEVLINFLKSNHKEMSKVAIRAATEKMPALRSLLRETKDA